MSGYQFGDGSNVNSRAAKIRELFVAGTTIYDHTEFCFDHDVWTKSEQRGLAISQARTEVREALGQLGPDGVPWAGATQNRKDGKPIWRQEELWSKRDYDFNYSAYRKRELSNRRIAANISRKCVLRFGEPPQFIDGVFEEE
jgi:hypothetical protein